MPNYRFHELSISSPVELPELVEIDAADWPSLPVYFEEVEATALDLPHDGQDLAQSATPDRNGTQISFGAGVEFVLPASAEYLTVRHLVDVDAATMRHLLLDHALPRLLAIRGYFSAHASGVNHNGRALIFLGDSGTGKSSMAAGLHRAGSPLLGDDCFTLAPSDDGTVTALSTYRSLRLLPASIDQFYPNIDDVDGAEFSSMGTGYDKVRVIERRMAHPEPMPVGAIFLLGDPEHVGPERLEPLSGRDAVVALTSNSFRLLTVGASSLGIALDQAEAIVRRVPVVSLHFERAFDGLDGLHKVIFDSID